MSPSAGAPPWNRKCLVAPVSARSLSISQAQSQATRDATGNPLSAYRIAGSSEREREKRPCALRIAAQASMAPGTVTASIEGEANARIPCGISALRQEETPAQPEPL